MDFIKNQINRIQQQLAALTPSQRMLAGALVVIMAMTVYWWTRYAGQAETKVLFDQVSSAEEIAAMTTALRVAGIQSTVTGGKIFVSAEDEIKAWSVLSYGQMLPRDTHGSFEDLLKSTSPFDPPGRTDQIMNEHRQNRLATMIRQYPGVASAMVLVDPKRERGPNGVEPSATVSMTMKRGESPTQQLVVASADLVSGAVASLQRARVKVIINGISYPVRNRDEATGLAGSDEYLANVQKAEAYYHDKLAKHFNFIEGAFFSVSVTPNIKRVTTKEVKIDPKSVLQKSVSENTNTEESRSNSRGGGEPGAVSNAPLTAGGAAETSTPEGNNSTTENNKTEYMVDYGRTNIETLSPGGDLNVTAAAIHVPRSYYVRAYQRKTNTDKEPEPTALETFTQEELRGLTKSARSCLGLATEESVTAGVFWDLMPVAGSSAASPAAAATSSIALALTDHAKEVALGVLALISLFMVSNIVKKNAPVPVAVVKAPVVEPRELDTREAAIGEAVEGIAALEAVELNEDEARGHQMQKQVADMVSSDPDAAASLIKRWLNRV
ncbi:MAG: flagellar M-ring protein FliF C-terminal domain-containing protein [Tepidisphaerales bacterium]